MEQSVTGIFNLGFWEIKTLIRISVDPLIGGKHEIIEGLMD
jgi:hypothetical protein